MCGGVPTRAALCVVAVAAVIGAAGCGSSDELTDEELFGSTTTTGASPSRPSLEGRFDAGARKLYLRCTGSGSPTVVFVHGSLRTREAAARGAGAAAGRLPSLLDRRRRSACTTVRTSGAATLHRVR